MGRTSVRAPAPPMINFCYFRCRYETHVCAPARPNSRTKLKGGRRRLTSTFIRLLCRDSAMKSGSCVPKNTPNRFPCCRRTVGCLAQSTLVLTIAGARARAVECVLYRKTPRVLALHVVPHGPSRTGINQGGDGPELVVTGFSTGGCRAGRTP